MHAELVVSTGKLLGALLTLVRVAGVFVFVPIPGITGVAQPARILLALGITAALFPEWPEVAGNTQIGQLVLWVMVEAGLGVGIGLLISFITEAFTLGAQILGLPAGYAFASTVDPATQADSTVLVIFAQLAGGLLFFTGGLDHQVLRIFVRSMETCPAGTFVLTRPAAQQVLQAGSAMFATGLRLALPIVAVLVMVDISLALLGRINSHLQLLMLAFPVKMLVALVMLAWTSLLMPAVFRAAAGQALPAARALIWK